MYLSIFLGVLLTAVVGSFFLLKVLGVERSWGSREIRQRSREREAVMAEAMERLRSRRERDAIWARGEPPPPDTVVRSLDEAEDPPKEAPTPQPTMYEILMRDED
jgi:hypothetical protein